MKKLLFTSLSLVGGVLGNRHESDGYSFSSPLLMIYIIVMIGIIVVFNILPKSTEGILLQNIRDEAHRFAIQYHRKLRSKQFLSNSLEDIHGIGKKTISNLLSQYGSIKNIKRAKLNDLTHVRGVTHKLAKNILQELNK